MSTASSLAITIAGIHMKNPVIAASGTFGFGKEYSSLVDLNKIGAIITKGTSLEPWVGNPPERIAETAAGMLNSIGLQNDGIENLINEKLPWLSQFDVPVIVNIVGHTIEEYAKVAQRLSETDSVAGLEINISCPNVKHGCIAFGVEPRMTFEVVNAVRKATHLPIIPKLSPNVADIVAIAHAAVDAGADAISLINTLIGTSINAETRTFRLANITGGLSGPAIKPIALRMVWEVAKAVDVPVIGVGGIMTAEDAVEFMLAGASAIQVGTANFVYPNAMIEIIEGLEAYLSRHGFGHISEIVGIVQSPQC
ncbi:MAG: dihydroorotate dehydrogenase [Armatimonadetes bacterium]|nr:dihydroorotate dehydrogenase [Armatimonadota bacterium]